MIQAIVKKGRVLPENVPAPMVTRGGALIKVVNSCISAGTELTNITGSGKSLIKRALEQPENITKVLNMVRSDGIARTYAKIMGKLETRSPLGYSVAGVVLAVGDGVTGRVGAGHGAGLASHAQVFVHLNDAVFTQALPAKSPPLSRPRRIVGKQRFGHGP